MDHLRIFLLIVNTLVGAAILLHTVTLRRSTPHPALGPFAAYVAFFTLLTTIDLVWEYAVANVYGGDMFAVPHLLIHALHLGILVTEFGIVVSLGRTVAELRGRAFPRWFQALKIACFAFFAAACLTTLNLSLVSPDVNLYYVVFGVWIGTMLGLIFAQLIWLLHDARTLASAEPERHRLLDGFARIFIVGFIVFALSEINFYFLRVTSTRLAPVYLLVVNLCPMIWLKRYFQPYQAARSAAPVSLDGFCTHYGISPREADILREVMTGKSNKEIEAALHISFNTVKNHVYNIFRKTGINSRSQLILLARDFKADDSVDPGR